MRYFVEFSYNGNNYHGWAKNNQMLIKRSTGAYKMFVNIITNRNRISRDR